MSTTASPAAAAREELAGFGGELIGPDDPTYDEARALFNAMIDKRPALISRPSGSEEVAAMVLFARGHDLPIAIRGGGHNGAGLASVDNGVVIDLSRLKAISVDPSSGSVRVGGGSVWGEVDAATQEHGLAVPAGIISTTGVGGLTLGGGSRLPDAPARPHDRQPALGRGRPRGRTDRNRERGERARPLLGDPRRRRELRSRHRVHVPGAARQHHRRRPDLLGARGLRRAACGLPRVAPHRTAQRRRVLRLPHRPARPAVPGGDPSAQGLRDRMVRRRLGRGGREGDGTDARCRRAAHARGGPDAAPGHERCIRRPLRPR